MRLRLKMEIRCGTCIEGKTRFDIPKNIQVPDINSLEATKNKIT